MSVIAQRRIEHANHRATAPPPRQLQVRRRHDREFRGLASCKGWHCRKARIRVTNMDNITTVMLPAQVDSETSASVEASILAALRPGGGVIVDGSEVTYMSAAGVRVFARALHRAEDKGARLVFCRFAGAAADCLLVSGFTQLFDDRFFFAQYLILRFEVFAHVHAQLVAGQIAHVTDTGFDLEIFPQNLADGLGFGG